MTWPFGGATQREITATDLLADRTRGRLTGFSRRVSRKDAFSHSAVWACLRLRADLISTMPADVFKRVGGVQVQQTKPPVLVEPGGREVRWMEWMYSTQVDLDSVGNNCGLITARDGLGLPARIELFNADDVSFIGKGSKISKVRVGRDEYDYSQVWHEKQFTISGCPVGLSPIAHAARTINAGLSAQDFASAWFGNSTMPGGQLKNTAKTLKRGEALRIKENFKEAVATGDVWVSGKDWEFSLLSAKGSEALFIEQQQFSITDVCRFLGVPSDMIDAESSSSTINYANITQRNLQLLIMNVGPAIARREEAISYGLLPRPRYLKLNRGAVLAMDLKSRYEAHGTAIDKRFLAPSEVRELEDRAPFTPEQVAEFAVLFPNKQPQPPGGNPS